MNPSLEAYLTDLYERGREHDAVRDTGGRLTTVEIDAARVAEARANLAAGHVDVVHGDGGQVLAAADGGFAVHVHEIGDGVLTAVRLPRS